MQPWCSSRCCGIRNSSISNAEGAKKAVNFLTQSRDDHKPIEQAASHVIKDTANFVRNALPTAEDALYSTLKTGARIAETAGRFSKDPYMQGAAIIGHNIVQGIEKQRHVGAPWPQPRAPHRLLKLEHAQRQWTTQTSLRSWYDGLLSALLLCNCPPLGASMQRSSSSTPLDLHMPVAQATVT